MYLHCILCVILETTFSLMKYTRRYRPFVMFEYEYLLSVNVLHIL